MAMNLATLLGEELHRLMRPLTDVAYGRDPMQSLRRLLRGCGWTVTADVDAQAIVDVIDSVVATSRRSCKTRSQMICPPHWPGWNRCQH